MNFLFQLDKGYARDSIKIIPGGLHALFWCLLFASSPARLKFGNHCRRIAVSLFNICFLGGPGAASIIFSQSFRLVAFSCQDLLLFSNRNTYGKRVIMLPNFVLVEDWTLSDLIWESISVQDSLKQSVDAHVHFKWRLWPVEFDKCWLENVDKREYVQSSLIVRTLVKGVPYWRQVEASTAGDHFWGFCLFRKILKTLPMSLWADEA